MTSDSRPRKVNDIEEYSFGDEMLLSLSERGIATSLNSSAQAIWELCDGRQTIEEISATLADRFGFVEVALRQELSKQVTATIEQFSQLGLVERDCAVNQKSN
jgi:Coenzyme PQQ synthesis protein D (PqqD)